MAKQTINIGHPDKGDGDKLRDAFVKVNENFDELYAVTGGGTSYHLGDDIQFVDIDPDSGTVVIQSGFDTGMPVYIKGANCSDGGVGGNVVIEAGGAPLPNTGTTGIVEISGGEVTIEADGGITTFASNGGAPYVTFPAVGDAQLSIQGGEIFAMPGTGGLALTSYDGNILLSTHGNIAPALVWEFDRSGTLTTPILFPVSFTAVLDVEHRTVGTGTYTGPAWEFNLEWSVAPNGEIGLMADNGPLPSLVVGYEDGQTFEFTEADHGIPGYTLTIVLSNVVQAGPAGWTANLNFSEPPVYPSTVNSLGAIKLTSNENSWIFGTDGNLTLPPGGDIVDSNGDSVLGGGGTANLGKFIVNGGNILATVNDSVPGAFGDYNINIDPGGESSAGISIPSVPNQVSGEPLQIFNTSSSGGKIMMNTHGGVTIASARGTLGLGLDLETPGVPDHFHVAFETSNSFIPTKDLFFGDDYNYLQLVNAAQGVFIGTNNRSGGDQHQWRFQTDGKFKLPAGGTIVDSNGTNILDGLSESHFGTVDRFYSVHSTYLVHSVDTGTNTFTVVGDAVYDLMNFYGCNIDGFFGITFRLIALQPPTYDSQTGLTTVYIDDTEDYVNNTWVGAKMRVIDYRYQPYQLAFDDSFSLDPNNMVVLKPISTLVNGSKTVTLDSAGVLSLPEVVAVGAAVIQPAGNGYNLKLISNGNVWNFDTDGNLTVPGEIRSTAGTGNVVIEANNGTTRTWTFGSDGSLELPNGSKLQTYSGGSTGLTSASGGIVEINADGGNKTWSFSDTGKLTTPGEIWAKAGDGIQGLTFSPNGSDASAFIKVDTGQNCLFQANGNIYLRQGFSDRLSISNTNTTLSATNNVRLSANGSGKVWVFGTGGNVTLPQSLGTGHADIFKDSVNVDGVNAGVRLAWDMYQAAEAGWRSTWSEENPSVDITTRPWYNVPSYAVLQILADNWIAQQLGEGFSTPAISADYYNQLREAAYIGLAAYNSWIDLISTVEIKSANKTWGFGSDGVLHLPPGGDIVDSNSCVSVLTAKEPKFEMVGGGLLMGVTAGKRYAINTTTGPVTLTLPSHPETGDAIFFVDSHGTFSTNNLTIDGYGNNIAGNSTITILVDNDNVGLFYNGTEWRYYA
jgi:hypothetical protein